MDETVEPLTCPVSAPTRRVPSSRALRKAPINWLELARKYVRSYIPPPVYWIPKYSPWNIFSDVLAGLTVGVMVVPQGLSFALVANLEPVYGLYVAMVTSFVYFLLGSSKYLIVGPTAVLSLLVGGFAKQGSPSDSFITDALLLSFLSGMILMILSFLRLGFLTNLLSKPISVGFTAGAAFLISFSQIKHIFGIPMETPETVITLIKECIHLAKAHTKPNPWAILMFSLCFAYIMILKQIKYTKMIPGPLFALIMGTLAAWGFNLPGRVKLNVVGHIPSGIPKPTSPFTTVDAFLRALPYSFIIAFLCFVESYTISKPLAIKEGSELRANQELFAMGFANLIGSFFSAFPAAGSFTRTVVNFSVGAKSQVAGFVQALVVLIVLLWATPLLRFLPYCVLAAIVMSGVINLFEFHDMIYIWKTKKRDFFVMVASFSLTLLLGVDTGVLVSIGIHVLLLVVATIKMRVEELVDSGGNVFVPILDDPTASPIPGIILAKVTDSLVYLNIESFMKQVERMMKQHGALLPGTQPATYRIIVDTVPINQQHNPIAQSASAPTSRKNRFNESKVEYDRNGTDEASAMENGARHSPASSSSSEHSHSTDGEEDDDDIHAEEVESPSVALDGEKERLLDPKKGVKEKEENEDPVTKYPNAVIFDFSMVNAVDSSSMMRLEELRGILALAGYSMHFAHVHYNVLEVMWRGDFISHLGSHAVFETLREALDQLIESKHRLDIDAV